MPRRRDEGRRRPAQRVDAAISDYLKSAGLDKRVRQAEVIPDWAELVGAQVAAVTEPLRVSANGTLFVAVRSNPWMNELSLLEPQLLAAINVVPGREPIRKIRWQVGHKIGRSDGDCG
jgi:predicted nucleic acid-binding Zn ribbon protein